MRCFRSGSLIGAAALLCLLPAAIVAQQAPPILKTNAPRAPSGPTPRTPDGHPDLSGVWNGLGDNLIGVPNQMANVGITVGSKGTRDIFSGAQIATFPRNSGANDWDTTPAAGQEGE